MYTYDPSKVVVSFKGIILLGPYAEGTFISAKRDAPLFTRKAGADGEVARARVKNKMGTVEFTLSQAAPANVILSQYALVGENAGLDVGVFQIADLSGTSLVHAEEAWIEEMPTQEFGAELSDRVWKLALAKMQNFIGYNLSI